MKRRVYHLAERAKLSADAALSALKAAGFQTRCINDQVPKHAVESALRALGVQRGGDNPQAAQAERAKPASVSTVVPPENLIRT